MEVHDNLMLLTNITSMNSKRSLLVLNTMSNCIEVSELIKKTSGVIEYERVVL